MTSSLLTWLSLKAAWDVSPWTITELRELAHKNVLQHELHDDTLYFEPSGFYMAMREELALDGYLSSREVATRFDIPHQDLLTCLEADELFAYATDTDWYLEPEVVERIPELFPDAFAHTPDKHAARSEHELLEAQDDAWSTTVGQPSLPFTSAAPAPTPPLPVSQPAVDDLHTWIQFKKAVQQSEFTHSELHQALKRGDVLSKRHEQGYLLVSKQSLDAYTPPQNWVTLDVYAQAMNQKERRRVLRRLESGQLEGRLMSGTWHLPSAPLHTF